MPFFHETQWGDNELLLRFHRIRLAFKEKRFRYIFSSPQNVIYFLILALRALVLRMIPRCTQMYFIHKDFSDKSLSTTDSDFTFKVFNSYTCELERYIQDRCLEDSELFQHRYANVIENRLKNGAIACALLDKDKIVSIFFASRKKTFIQQIGYYYIPPINQVVITDIYTLRSYRKTGLYSLLLQQAIAYFRQDGISIFVMWIMKHNRATIQAQIKAGFAEIFQTVSLFSWFGLEKVTVDHSMKPLDQL